LATFLQAVAAELFRLGAVLACTCVAIAAPFSHKTHLALKLACVSCHASASASTKLADNNLPTTAICKNCHEQDKVSIKQPRPNNLQQFNHQLHLKLGNVAPVIAKAIDSKQYLSNPGDTRKYLNTKNPCAACHRGLEESNEVSAAAFPRMADCLTCHQPVDPPFSCGKCHTEGPELKPANHTADWLDRHNRANVIEDKTTCAVCHGRKFTCLGCH
jgi:hypothetical protein